MKTSAAGRKFITQEEGVRTKAYQDSRGIWTIGVGHTSAAGLPKVLPGMTLSASEVDEVLSKDLEMTEQDIISLVKVPLSQNEFDALVSLVFNIGPSAFKRSTVLRRLNAGDKPGAAEAILMWCKAGNNPTLLLARRQREKALFLKASQSPVEAPAEVPATPVAPTSSNWLVRLFMLILKAFK